MSELIRRPMRSLRLLIVAAMLASFVVTSPVAALAESDDTLPGIAAPDSPFQGSVEATGDVVDIYRFSLTEGQFISLDVTQTAEATASVGFFGPSTTDVSDLSSAISSATIDTSSSVFAADFTAQEGGAGNHYLSVAAVSGDSTYTVDWSISDPSFSLDSASTTMTVTGGQSAADRSFSAEWGELGSVPVTFTAESDQPWLVVTPGTGHANSNTSQELTLAADTATLPIGSHEALVTVRILGAAPQTHLVTVNVLDPDTPEPDDTLPGIAAPASPFQGAVDPLTDKRDVYSFDLTEGQFLHVEVAQSAETTAVASLFGPGASEPIDPASAISSGTVTSGADYVGDVTANGGEAGTYYLNVAAVSGDSTYTVDWSISNPSFSLGSTNTTVTVTEGQSAADRFFDVNWGQLGSEPVTFTVESDQTWLSATPVSGDASSNTSQTLTLAADTSSLSIGSYEATVTVRILGTAEQTHLVTVNVLDPDTPEPDDTLPGIAAPSSPFQGAVDPVTDRRDVYSFDLTEGQFLHVEVSQSAETTALASLFGPGASEPIDPASAISSGTVTSGTDYVVDVTANGGEAGTYFLDIAAVAGGSTYTVDWSISNPTFSLDSTSTAVTVVQGESAADRFFDVNWGQLGSEPVAYTVESDQTWLTATPVSGDAGSNTSQKLTLSADTTALAIGSHEATVTVRILGAAPQTHVVTVNVLEPTVARIARSAPKARTTTSGSLIVKYGTRVTLYASLRNPAGVLMPSKQMTLQRSYDNKTWRGITSPVSANGFFAASTKVYRKTYFRWVFSGDDTAAASVTPSALVYSYAYVTPPKNIPSRVRPNRTYYFYGYLRPKHAQGASAIRLQFQYYYRGKWRSDTSLKVRIEKNLTYDSRYRYADRYVRGVPRSWRVRAVHGDTSHLTTYSSWKYYKVY